MKLYTKPAIEIAEIETEDIITVSSVGGEADPYRLLKTSVNGNEGADYGTQEVSVFDR